jgi:hypothetical protein
MNINVENSFPVVDILVWSLFLCAANASIIKSDIQPAKFLHGLVDGRIDRVLLGSVHLDLEYLDILVLFFERLSGRLQDVWTDITQR